MGSSTRIRRKSNLREVFAFGDAHSHHKSVKQLLFQEGLIDKSGGHRLRPEVLVVSLGDLANCVRTSRDDDLKALSMVGPIIDRLVLGNHESPYLNFDSFAGFFAFPEVKERIKDLYDRSLIVPCWVAGDILLSHAGVASEWPWESAEEASKAITEAFMYNAHAPILRNCGWSRGGRNKYGGILWSDWSEPKSMKFRQIVGHTVGNDIRYYVHGKSAKLNEPMSIHLTDEDEDYYNPTYNIDIGCNLTGWHPQGELAGAWIRKSGEIEFVKLNHEPWRTES